MRDFFLDLLNNLDKLTGLKQLEKLMALPDPKKEINQLLDILCRTCEMFPLIPKDAQKSIISHYVVSDGELTSLNAKIVFKWLNANREKYFKEAAHIPTEPDPNWKPLEGEARAKWLAEWQKSLQGIGEGTPTISHVKQLEMSLPKKTATYHPVTTADDIMQKELHIQYIRENYDPITKEKRPTWLAEDEWLKNQKDLADEQIKLLLEKL